MIDRPPRVLATLCLSAIAATLAGCGSLTGLDAAASFGCRAPDGVQCQSVSDTYFSSHAGVPATPPATAPAAPAAPASLPRGPTGDEPPRQIATASTAATPRAATLASPAVFSARGNAIMPIRTPPQDIRLWVKAWEDSDGDLVGESLVYVHIDGGRWQVDHVHRQTREAFAPVRAGVQQPRATGRSRPADDKAPAATAAQAAGAGLAETLRALQSRMAGQGTPAE